MADVYLKWAAESPFDPVDRDYLQEASLAHLAQRTAEARPQSTREWIQGHHVSAKRRYRHPRAEESARAYRGRGRG